MTQQRSMAVVGAGVVGQVYAGRLAEAGHGHLGRLPDALHVRLLARLVARAVAAVQVPPRPEEGVGAEG